MKIFVVLVLCACAFADEMIVRDLERVEGIEGHEVIPPPPGFEMKGLKGLTGFTGFGESRLVGNFPTSDLTTEIVRGEHYVDAPIYSSPPLSIVDHERVDLVPTSNYYNHHGGQYVIVPPSRSQPISSPLRNYLVGTPSSGQYLYSPAPVHKEVIPSTGYQYLYSAPAAHSNVVPTSGVQYIYESPTVHTGSQFHYSPAPVHAESPYVYSPSAPVAGERYIYSPSNVNYYMPEVDHREIPVLRAPTPNHPRNGASVYYAKWQ